jgi:hypothetical protein
MTLLKKLLYKFNGLHYPREYLCIAEETFQQPLHVYLAVNANTFKDITKLHCFVGYSPLVFAFPASLFPGQFPENMRIVFSHASVNKNVSFNEKDAIATLFLRKIQQQGINENSVLFYEGLQGTHRFLSGFHQSVLQLSNRIYGKKPGNVFLEGNLYKQVQIAYSIPRKICLITVGKDNLFNLFPTDLHGQVNNQYYIISLRHTGHACRQVEASGRIVLSDMNANACKKVYSLGKNHMQPLKDKTSFDFSEITSKTFHLPLPNHFTRYKELELEESFIYGIHKILLFKIVNGEQNGAESTLAHIHNTYATWRYKKNLQSNYLLA